MTSMAITPADTEAAGARRPETRQPLLTVIVPTRNEAGNIEPLLRRVEEAVTGNATEVIFVDDSTDQTPEVITRVADSVAMSVRVLHRPPERRADGLGGAVVEGIRAASGEWVCIMDADLQHPPEIIPELLGRARSESVDLVIASRFAPTAKVGGLSAPRVVASLLTRLSAQLLFPRQLSRVSDPLSGFFLFRRLAVDPDRLHPRGFKILLEILIRVPGLTVSELPFRFQPRHAGSSKADAREGLRYLRLLLDLRWQGQLERLMRFGMVGATGLVVNQLLLAACTELIGLHYLISAVLATQGSTGWNFILTDAWVFRDRATTRSALSRFIQSALMNNLLLLGRGPLLVALTSGLGVHYLVSNLVTLLAFMLTRYLISDRWIWSEGATQGTFHYDVHGILRIASEAPLPELAYFRTGAPLDQPHLRIRIGRGGRPRTKRPTHAVGDGFFRYCEALGPLGFWVEIARDDVCTEVVAGHLLRWSPHVLYTNVVEPMLRWMLVQQGYALMHGACVASGDEGLLVTARTDTGKTSTLLRLLARQRLGFLSDDMVILRPDGAVLCYPKPLTISHHTLDAVTALGSLSRFERLALRVQSRVHSRSGRRFAKLLARMPLPVATINAVVQLVIPPPKYTINRLIPSVELRQHSRITHRVEIERGPDLEALIEPWQAHITAIEDCEDAYGFPPYAALEPFLSSCNGRDLRRAEQQIIATALGDRPTTLIRRQARDWWSRIGELYVWDHHSAGDTRPALDHRTADGKHVLAYGTVSQTNGTTPHGHGTT
jgi:dolichol-phosphate mannosyltransferase